MTGGRERGSFWCLPFTTALLHDHGLPAPALSRQPDPELHTIEEMLACQSPGKQGDESMHSFVTTGSCGHKMKFLSSLHTLNLQLQGCCLVSLDTRSVLVMWQNRGPGDGAGGDRLQLEHRVGDPGKFPRGAVSEFGGVCSLECSQRFGLVVGW